jgi:hypothetical protein
MKSISTPAKILFLFTFFSSLVSTFYAAWELRLPLLIDVFSPIVYAWLLWWWLTDDSRRSNLEWPAVDLGFFVYIAWFAIIPYHLFKTRGVRGLLGILALVGAYIAGWLSGVWVIYVVWLS